MRACDACTPVCHKCRQTVVMDAKPWLSLVTFLHTVLWCYTFSLGATQCVKNCTPPPEDELQIQRIRAHLLADSCPQPNASRCNWSGDDSASCYIRYYDARSKVLHKAARIANWNFLTNITEENAEKKKEASKIVAGWQKEEWNTTTRLYNYPDQLSQKWRRLFKRIKFIGASVLNEEKFEQYQNISLKMLDIFSSARVCPYENQSCNKSSEGLPLNDLQNKKFNGTDYKNLEYYWTAFRNETGRKLKTLYQEFVVLLKEIAVAHGKNDMGQIWRDWYGDENFREEISRLWKEVKPFYEQLHAYVRHKLHNFYKDVPEAKDFKADGLIPAHLLGDLYSQVWHRKFDLLKLADVETVDVTKALKQKYPTVLGFFKEADRFFQSLGLDPLPKEFYEKSIFERQPDRKMDCHATAWDIDVPDVRIRMCTQHTLTDFDIVHHEIGHIQYYLTYSHLSLNLHKTGANPGFHEAIGDLISLSVNTPTHLKSLGLYNTSEEGSNETANDLNFLLRTALKKVAFMPYSYIMDKYRWSLFEGEILPEELNAAWWKLRQEEQGIKAPNLRTEEDFDIGSKWHIVSNFGYVRYFVANVLQFSFHKHFCKIAGQYDEENPDAKPLHLCDISAGSYPTAVGEDFRKLLSLGASVPDDKQLEMFTGSSKMTMEAVLEYFRPLRIEIESLEASSQVLPYFPGHSYGDNETAVTIDGSSGTLPVEGFKKPSRSSNDGKEPENESCIQGGERNDSTEAAGDYLDIPDFDDQLENQTNLLKTEEPVFIPP